MLRKIQLGPYLEKKSAVGMSVEPQNNRSLHCSKNLSRQPLPRAFQVVDSRQPALSNRVFQLLLIFEQWKGTANLNSNLNFRFVRFFQELSNCGSFSIRGSGDLRLIPKAVPTLVMHGGDDQIVLVKDSAR